MAKVKRRELRQMVEKMKPVQFLEHISDALEDKELRPDDFSIRDLFEATVEDGEEAVRAMNPQENGGSGSLLESGAIDMSLFKNVSGQILFTAIMESYESPQFVWPKLARVISTKLDGEKIPGIGGLGNAGGTVEPGKDYPRATVSEMWIETPSTAKKGFIVEVTKEAIFYDRTNLVLEQCGKVGESLGIGLEHEIIDLAIGETNNYKFKGKSLNTYTDASGLHDWDNLFAGNGLTTYLNLDAASQGFGAVNDPATGQPILIAPTQIVIHSSKRAQALAILNAIQVEQDTNAAAGTTIYRTAFDSKAITGNFEVITSPQIDRRYTVGSVTATDWFFGDFRKAFAYMEAWPIKVDQAPANSEADFNRDIVAQFKASRRGVGVVYDPRYVQQHQA